MATKRKLLRLRIRVVTELPFWENVKVCSEKAFLNLNTPDAGVHSVPSKKNKRLLRLKKRRKPPPPPNVENILKKGQLPAWCLLTAEWLSRMQDLGAAKPCSWDRLLRATPGGY